MSSVACPLCQASNFPTAACLISALIKFIDEPLKCPLCACRLQSAASLREHLVNHSHTQQSGKYVENLKGRNLPSDAPHPVTQVTNSTIIKSFKCRQCSYEAADIMSLHNHLNAMHPERKFLCNHCLKSFKVQASLTLHMRLAHSETVSSYECRHCRKRFLSQGRRDQHERKHHNPRESSCSEYRMSPNLEHQGVCDKNPVGSDDLSCESTGVGHPEERSFVCLICDKTFKKDQYLQQHIRTHEAKKWECQVCHKLFTTKEYLRKHTRLHTGETPYSCDLCSKTFTFQQSYHKHLLYHSDERPYGCDDCGRRFKELSTLHNHQRIHTGEKPFQCETCGKAFRQRVSYIVHQRIHTGALPYVCTNCGKSFRYKVSQRSHKCEKKVDNQLESSLRPAWLERLAIAQQNVTKFDGGLDKGEGTKDSLDAILSVNNQNVNDTVNFDTVMDIGETMSQSNIYPKMQYFPNDNLPTIIDLSQLTLSLDSELIFPS